MCNKRMYGRHSFYRQWLEGRGTSFFLEQNGGI